MVLNEKAIGQESEARPAVPSLRLRLRAAFALPLMEIAVYLAFYVSGLWDLGSVQLAPQVFYAGPVPHLAFAAIISFGMWRYAAARPPAVLASGAVLFVLLSLISTGLSAVTQQLPSLRQNPPLFAAVSIATIVISIVLTSAAVMLVARSAAPALRRRSYWRVALIMWPFAAFLTSAILTSLPMFLIVNGDLDRPSMPYLLFAIRLVWHCIIFWFIGVWLDRDNRRRNAIPLAFG